MLRIAVLTVLAVLASGTALAQSNVAPHFADGGGWTTTMLLTNTNNTIATAQMTFYSGGQATSMELLIDGKPYESDKTTTLTAQPNTTVRITTRGTAATPRTGFIDVQGAGYNLTVIYRQTVPGRPDFETAISAVKTIPASYGMHWDNRDGATTAIAMANVAVTTTAVTITALDEAGNKVGDAFIALGPSQQKAFVLSDELPAAAGKRGYLRVTQTQRSVAILGLLFNQTGPFSVLGTF